MRDNRLMNYSLKRNLILFSLLALLAISAVSFPHAKTKAYAQSAESISVSESDLMQAGYSGVTLLQPQGTLYQQPNIYFDVDEGAQDGVSNLVMISQYTNGSTYNYPLFSYGTDSHTLTIDGVNAQEADLANQKVALNFAKGNYYIVIIAPNQEKVEALASIIAGKI